MLHLWLQYSGESKISLYSWIQLWGVCSMQRHYQERPFVTNFSCVYEYIIRCVSCRTHDSAASPETAANYMFFYHRHRVGWKDVLSFYERRQSEYYK